MINSKQKLPAPLLSLILVVFPFTVVYWRIHGLINKESLTSATITSEMSNSNQNQGTLLSHFDEANNARYLSALKLVVDGDYQTSQDFEGFNNKTGVDKLIAPNIVHYIRFNCASFKFYEYICLRSAYLQQHPDYIFIHTNVNRFKGKYWNWIEKEADLRTRIVLIKTEIPTEIFGQNFSSFYKVHHASDVVRHHT